MRLCCKTGVKGIGTCVQVWKGLPVFQVVLACIYQMPGFWCSLTVEKADVLADKSPLARIAIPSP